MDPIGFQQNSGNDTPDRGPMRGSGSEEKAVPSIVQVYFPERNRTLAYYNDRFDLRVGDIVFVDGKLEGLRGQVRSVSTHFKVKAGDYRRVIGRADARIAGRFYQVDSFD